MILAERAQRGAAGARGIRAEVVAAMAILTRLPVASTGARSGAGAFGLVGAGLGLVVAAPLLAIGAVAPLPAATFGIALLALASGALHLDGLADTADALAASTPEAGEWARRDPRLGAAGVVALVAAVLLEASLLATLLGRDGPLAAALAVVVAGASSRAAAPLVACLPRAWERPGFGSWFAERTSPRSAAVAAGSATLIALAIAGAFDRVELVPALAVGMVSAGAAGMVLARLRRGLDGDALGAIVEVAFVATLFAVVAAPGRG